MINRYLGFGLAALFALSATANSKVSAPLTSAHVAQGALAGKSTGSVTAFLGVPFAAPPVGNLRWKPPLAAPPWMGVRAADHFAASCQQPLTPNGFGPWTKEYVVTGTVSEDCLYLNIWTPAHARTARLPVMVWIHGGGFSSGSGSVPIYDGAKLAAKGIIVVTINYRLGVYGFLARDDLAAESQDHASGNYGLLDQIAALHWIKENIAAFGGAPDNVTIAGQSAGAAAVHHLIASPLARGLFKRAIAESGSGMGLTIPGAQEARRLGQRFGEATGESDISTLRALSSAQIDAAAARLNGNGPGGRFGPVVDGLVINNANDVDHGGSDVPILTGLAATEMASLDPAYGQATPETLKILIEKRYGRCADQVAAAYPARSAAEANAQVDAIAQDRVTAGTLLWARQRLERSAQPIYVYRWEHWEPGPQSAHFKAFHSSEIPYVFGTLSTSPERPFSRVDHRLSAMMGSYWVNWVKAGNPNGRGLPHWSAVSKASENILVINRGIGLQPSLPAQAWKVFNACAKAGVSLGIM